MLLIACDDGCAGPDVNPQPTAIDCIDSSLAVGFAASFSGKLYL
jgi:hypothetical protein